MARSSCKVELHHSAIGDMLQGAGVRADMLARAERAAEAARAAAPVVSGTYRDSIEAYTVTTDRAVGRVGSSVPYAGTVEANHGTLSRALDAAG